MSVLGRRLAPPSELPAFVAALAGLVSHARALDDTVRRVEGDAGPTAPPTAFVHAVAGLLRLRRDLAAHLLELGVDDDERAAGGVRDPGLEERLGLDLRR